MAGGVCCRPVIPDQSAKDIVPESLAEWRCRTLGGELPTRGIGSRHRHQRKPSQAIAERIRSILPAGSDSSRSRKEHTRRTSVLYCVRPCCLLATPRRSASSIRMRRLIHKNIPRTTKTTDLICRRSVAAEVAEGAHSDFRRVLCGRVI
jgi:hypothetical protein